MPIDAVPDYCLRRNNIISIWRLPENGHPSLATQTLWFLRQTTEKESSKKRSLSITGYDLNYLLDAPIGNVGRIVAYYAGSAQAAKTDNADDMIKAIARQNFGQAGTDYNANSRKTPFLDIDADYALAPSITKAFAWRNIAQVFQEICKTSYENGTFLAYDFVVAIPPTGTIPEPTSADWWPASTDQFKIVFKTFTGQRGNDHTRVGGDPVLFGIRYGNLDNVVLTKDYSEEINDVYVGGDNVDAARTIVRVSKSGTIVNGWIWNKREKFINAVGIDTVPSLTNEGESAIKKPTISFEGEIKSTPNCQYGRHWGWGDKVSVEFRDYSFDAWINKLTVYWSLEEGETISSSISAEGEL
jgi:hypothetical protein